MDRRPGRLRPRGHLYETNLRGCGPGRPLWSLTVVFISICLVFPTLLLAQITEADGPTSTSGEESSSFDPSTSRNALQKDTAASEPSPFTENLQPEVTYGSTFELKKTESLLFENTGTTAVISVEMMVPAAASQSISGSTTQHVTTVTASPTLREEPTPYPSNSVFDSSASTTPSLKSSAMLGDPVHLKRVLTVTSETSPAPFTASEIGLHETISGKEMALRDYGTLESSVIQDVSMVPVIREASTTSTSFSSTQVSTMLHSTPFIPSTQATLTHSFHSKIKVVQNMTAWNENHGKSQSADHVALVDVEGSSSTNGSSMGWPTKMAAVVEGDLVLGGLMMVHEREDTITCGPIMPQGGVQALEAMLYTLDVINAKNMLPGITLGAHILDDCDKDTYGLEMAVDFIKVKYPDTHYCWSLIFSACSHSTITEIAK